MTSKWAATSMLPESFPLAVSRARHWIAVATIDAVTRPAPLPVGEQLLVWDSDEYGPGVAGSVSGGCVDADVIDVARRVLADGQPRTREYGPPCGLESGATEPRALTLEATTCGGTLRVGIERITVGTESQDADRALEAIAARRERTCAAAVGAGRLFLLGASTVSTHLARIAASIGLQVTVIDPRRDFATAVQVPAAHHLVRGWPDRELRATELTAGDAVVLLTHDDRYGCAALTAALSGGAGYVGALASTGTATNYRRALSESGVSAEHIDRLRSPVGIAVDAIGPAEIAVAVAAELIAFRRST